MEYDFKKMGLRMVKPKSHANNVREYIHLKTGIRLVFIPGGSFAMGSADNARKRYHLETPQHRVTLQPFMISKYVVTQKIWTKVMAHQPWSGQAHVKNGDHYPAVYISWQNAHKFCRKTGLTLPSEAQWEYACRAHTQTAYYWGEEFDIAYSWYLVNTCYVGKQYAQVVGRKKANSFGLCDMLGNVWEWCADTWHNNYQGAPTNGKAWVDASNTYKVLRGGSFSYKACRCAQRRGEAPGRKAEDFGFRVVKKLL